MCTPTPQSRDITRLSFWASKTAQSKVSQREASDRGSGCGGRTVVTESDKAICVCAEKTITLKEQVDPSILTSMREGAPQALTGVPRRPVQ